MAFEFDDGGRKAAGYKGFTGDCFVRAAAIASGTPYDVIYAMVNAEAKKERIGKRKDKISDARKGVYIGTAKKVMAELGFEWVPTMTIGSGCKVHVRASELPKGCLVLRLSKHFAAFIDGTLRDTYDSSRDGTRGVYGYWIRKEA